MQFNLMRFSEVTFDLLIKFSFTVEEFELWQVYFRHHNNIKVIRKNNSHISISGKICVRDFDFAGKQALWDLFCLCESQQPPGSNLKTLSTQEMIAQYIVTLYTSLHQSLQSRAQIIHQELMDKCLTYLQGGQPSLASKCITLILMLFNVFQTGQFQVQKAKQFPGRNAIPITFKAQLIINGQSKSIECKESDTVTYDQFKRKIGEEYNAAYKQIDVIVEGQNVEQENDLADIYIPTRIAYCNVKIQINTSYHPKNYLSQNISAFNLLFKLLQQNTLFTHQVWELLNKLPNNAELKESVKSFKKMFDNDFYKSMYVAQIVIDLSENPAWKQKFQEQSQVAVLVQKYLGHYTNPGPLEKHSCLLFSILLNLYLKGQKPDNGIQVKAVQVLQKLSEEISQRECKKKSNDHETEAQLLRESLQLLKLFPEGVNYFFNDRKSLQKRLEILLIDNDNIKMKNEFVKFLLQDPMNNQNLAQVLIGPLLGWVVEENKQRCEQYFELTCEMFRREPDLSIFKIEYGQVISQIIENINSLGINEKTHKIQDFVLIGLMKLLQVLLERFEQMKYKVGSRAIEVIQKALVELETDDLDKKEIIKCKSSGSRQAAFNCLFSLLSQKSNMDQLVKFIQPLHLTSVWRTKNFNDWNISSKFNEKSSTGYVGLYNLGCSKRGDDDQIISLSLLYEFSTLVIVHDSFIQKIIASN